MNRTLLEKVRCMLSNAGLGKQFWAKAVMYASHLINRLPSGALNGKTPLEVWSGKPINDYDTLHAFGSTAYYHVKESKFDPRAKKALFMGLPWVSRDTDSGVYLRRKLFIAGMLLLMNLPC